MSLSVINSYNSVKRAQQKLIINQANNLPKTILKINLFLKNHFKRNERYCGCKNQNQYFHAIVDSSIAMH